MEVEKIWRRHVVASSHASKPPVLNGLSDIHEVGLAGRDVQHGEAEAPSPPIVHSGVRTEIVERCRAGDRSLGR
jgi:hypothetical protein